MLFLGIDPGVNGGVAMLDDDGAVVNAVKMPATDKDLFELLTTWPESRLPMCGLGPWHATIERVNAGVFGKAGRMGVVSAWTFGRGVGALEMALVAADIPFDRVAPAKWQQALGCRSGGDKNITKRRAQELFPKVKITHCIADALLIAEYGRRQSRGLVAATAKADGPR